MDLYNFFEYIRRLRVYSIDTDRGIERPGHTPLDGTMVWVRAVAGILHPFNHLARGNESVRRRQAGGLRKWAEAQSPPLLAIGDYNFDYDFHTQTGYYPRRDWPIVPANVAARL